MAEGGLPATCRGGVGVWAVSWRISAERRTQSLKRERGRWGRLRAGQGAVSPGVSVALLRSPGRGPAAGEVVGELGSGGAEAKETERLRVTGLGRVNVSRKESCGKV